MDPRSRPLRDPAFDPPQDPYLSGIPKDDGNATPSMAQFIEIKSRHPDCMLFYRMGDFYELFFRDAEIAAKTLGIVLTKRGKHAGEDIPMCGVPVIRSDEYLHKLISHGLRVAICEQLEDPAEARRRGSKAIVKRDVVRIVTPGTITEDGLLAARRANRLSAIARQRNAGGGWAYALAAVDISTGDLVISPAVTADLPGEIARLDPAELLLPDGIREDVSLRDLWQEASFAITRLPKEGFDPQSAEKRLCDYFGIATLDAFGNFSRAEMIALAQIIVYLERTQLGLRPPLSRPRRDLRSETLALDAATRANLELTRTLAGREEGSLLQVIDRTVTSSGARLLHAWLSAPLTNRAAIMGRQDAIAGLISADLSLDNLRKTLTGMPDFIRALQRLALDRAGPRDLRQIGHGLVMIEHLAALLSGMPGKSELLSQMEAALLKSPAALGHRVIGALRDDAPLQKRDGGFIAPGFDAALDTIFALRDNSRQVIAPLQLRYAEETGQKALKIKANNQLGYFVELPQQAGEKLLQAPFNALFVHRQTMAGSMRFTTGELSGLEQKIAEASMRALECELAHFAHFAREVLLVDHAIRKAAEAVAMLDCCLGLAMLARRENWARPEITEDFAFAVTGARHPVVEAALAKQGERFIANGCDLSARSSFENGRIQLVTGANMAGKSTYLRQNALLILLAQIGSYVPAAAARIGIVDRLYSRVGAADDLARGRSTFMVEMVETAAILNQAGERSFVILDEIGRGTATYDGLSIAWAAIEHLHDTNRCRGLFATHFHELTALVGRASRLDPVTMKVAHHQGEVVFLHEVMPGAADRSYGIQVASLAGLPGTVLARAEAILKELERKAAASPALSVIDDLPLFRNFGAAPDRKPAPDPALLALEGITPDEMTPKEALDALYRLKGLMKKDSRTQDKK